MSHKSSDIRWQVDSDPVPGDSAMIQRRAAGGADPAPAAAAGGPGWQMSPWQANGTEPGPAGPLGLMCTLPSGVAWPGGVQAVVGWVPSNALGHHKGAFKSPLQVLHPTGFRVTELWWLLPA